MFGRLTSSSLCDYSSDHVFARRRLSFRGSHGGYYITTTILLSLSPHFLCSPEWACYADTVAGRLFPDLIYN